MTKSRLFASLSIVALVMTVACQSTPKRVAFTTLDGVATVVHTAMGVANELYQKGNINEDGRTQILDAYKKYQSVALVAVSAVTLMPNTVTNADGTTSRPFTLAPPDLIKAANDLLNAINVLGNQHLQLIQ